MDISVAEAAVAAASAPGLSSAEVTHRLSEFGPNAVAEERAHPMAWIMRHFWAPVSWMLEATIALQIVIGERLEAALIATLLLLNVDSASSRKIVPRRRSRCSNRAWH